MNNIVVGNPGDKLKPITLVIRYTKPIKKLIVEKKKTEDGHNLKWFWGKAY